MNPTLYWLALTCGLTALMALPYIMNMMKVWGVIGALGDPLSQKKSLSLWAQRAKRAHYNAIENLVVFAGLVLCSQFTNLDQNTLETPVIVYFFARLVHYVVYTLGITILRTMSYLIGWGAQMFILIKVLQC